MTIAKKPQNEPVDEPNRAGYILSRSNHHNNKPGGRGSDAAANLIRDKLAKLYASEPDALQEEKEAEAVPQRSKHQQYMYDLNHSGKDLAQIQIEWHAYYQNLNDQEKHQVWQEFYENNEAAKQPKLELPADTPTAAEKIASVRNQLATRNPLSKPVGKDTRSAQTVQEDLRRHIKHPAKLTRKQHLQSLLFGLAIGGVVVFIFLFSFFNEVLIAPFIQPSRASADTPLIISSDTVAATSTPQVIIPKINVQIPVNFDGTSTDESVIENDLESGVVHYPTTAMPGQNGNAAFFGHSSNNIFNKGKYKFAFVLLHELVPGDTFYITKDSKVYAYKVFSKTVVSPSTVSVLNPIEGHTATATLITCDPPGTSLNRLIVVGDQISPSVSGNSTTATTSVAAADSAVELAGNGQTLWGHFISTGAGKVVTAVVVLGAVLVIARRINKRR